MLETFLPDHPMIRLTYMLVLLAPLALAHVPPGPASTCQDLVGERMYHDYILFSDVGGPSLRAPLVDGTTEPCAPTDVISYDGHREFGIGLARLDVTTGDGTTSGTAACFGPFTTGHHSYAIEVQDVVTPHVVFTVLSDYSIPGFEQTPDCGDGQVTPCSPTPPPPSTQPFPVNVVEDVARGLLETGFGAICNPLDHEARFIDAGVMTFGPGANGTYLVVIEADTDLGYVPVAGHVWTT